MRSNKANPTLGKVIRPAISRWLHKKVEFFRSEKSVEPGNHAIAGVVSQDTRARVVVTLQNEESTGIVALQASLDKANAKIVQIEADLELTYEKARATASNLRKTKLQRERTVERLSQASEPIPESATDSLSMLQESYVNFSVAAELQEQKHADLLMRVEHLNDSHNAHTAILESVQAKILSIKSAEASNEDNFERAA